MAIAPRPKPVPPRLPPIKPVPKMPDSVTKPNPSGALRGRSQPKKTDATPTPAYGKGVKQQMPSPFGSALARMRARGGRSY
jgi:hypothetical protein